MNNDWQVNIFPLYILMCISTISFIENVALCEKPALSDHHVNSSNTLIHPSSSVCTEIKHIYSLLLRYVVPHFIVCFPFQHQYYITENAKYTYYLIRPGSCALYDLSLSAAFIFFYFTVLSLCLSDKEVQLDLFGNWPLTASTRGTFFKTKGNL